MDRARESPSAGAARDGRDRTPPRETPGYRLKKRLLGPPLVTERLAREKLSKPMALGVLSSDCISSSAYGSEEMLRILVPVAGTAAFALLMPVTLAILCVLLLLTLSYRDVVTSYTRAGGSYVVARDNFGPDIAQIAAVALLIDYIVTVAVQTAAGTDALISLVHLVGHGYTGLDHLKLPISVAVVLLLCWGNLRGVREAGRAFAAPAYLFMAALTLLFAVGFTRVLLGDLPTADVRAPGAVPLGTPGPGLLYGISLFMVLRSFANGGSSLTGLEAISNSVSAFREPQGRNARRTLVIMASVLGVLVLGVSTLARFTRAVPYADGNPTVVAQEAALAFGGGAAGTAGLVFVQLATALVLYTGANTSFSGFPFLASFVAEDSFLPRQLTRRGHRLAFSSGITVLTAVSLALLVATRASVDALVAFYAIGVFTGFTMATAGMARHHWVRTEPHRGARIAVNTVAAVVSATVVLIFAVTKFAEGAWLVVVVFPLGVWALIRVNRRYREEAAALAAAPEDPTRPSGRRHVLYILVDRVDLAVVKAIRYARTLRPQHLQAVHFMVDDREAAQLRRQWEATDVGELPLTVVECPDRRILRALLELIARTTADGSTEVTLLIPERTYSPVLGRLLHRRTADRIARTVGKMPHVVAVIVPFDVVEAVEEQEAAAGRDHADGR